MAPPPIAPVAAALLLAALLALASLHGAAATGVFQVHRKFTRAGGEGGGNITVHLAHDVSRRGRLLAAADVPLGGLGLPTGSGLYYTKIEIGTPPKQYHVQVDTGSDILWVNCISCDKCPKKSGLGIDLMLYDPKGSSSGSTVSCEQEFCVATYGDKLPGCKASRPCEYSVTYGDGSSTTGYFVTDSLQYNQVSGDGQTRYANANITFGPHYNVKMKSIDVGGTALQLPPHIFETGEKKGTIIDSGTTLTYLPELVYKDIMAKIFEKHQDMTFRGIQDFLCFQYHGSVDDGFPKITFHFEGDLGLHVYPHDYFFQNGHISNGIEPTASKGLMPVGTKL
ncbi:hypothetical protein ACQ4PT_010413 [Festuca glaucescens]